MKYTLYIIIGMALLLTGCNDRLIFSDYEHTPVAGWEKTDPVEFDIPPLEEDGDYGVMLSMRLSDAYPFKKLYLNVCQTVYPSGKQTMDTLSIQITDSRGTMLGSGVTYHQYDNMLSRQHFNRGDSIHFEISHNMKREILPGISDVGISITKE